MTPFDDLALLRAFICMVECGSVSAGARHHRAPPSREQAEQPARGAAYNSQK
jgi:hypothetical protein